MYIFNKELEVYFNSRGKGGIILLLIPLLILLLILRGRVRTKSLLRGGANI